MIMQAVGERRLLQFTILRRLLDPQPAEKSTDDQTEQVERHECDHGCSVEPQRRRLKVQADFWNVARPSPRKPGMKAVGNNPIDRYVGPETGTLHRPTAAQPTSRRLIRLYAAVERPSTPKIT